MANRHYYARYESLDHELRDVFRYDSREQRDRECSPPMQDGRGWLVPVTEKEASRMARELHCLRPYERFFGELVWIGAWSPVLGHPCEKVYLRTH